MQEGDKKHFICIICIQNETPFGLESDDTFQQTNTLGFNTQSNLANLNFSLNKNEKRAIKQISNLIIENNDPENENTNFCKYYSVDEFCDKKFNKTNNFSIFHQNIHSLQYHFEDLKILLESLEHDFDIITISETKLQTNVFQTKNISLPNYQYEHTATEANKGGTLVYISNKLNYKPRKDLEIYETKNLESTFVEIINPKDKNTIIGCIYKHHTISQHEFIDLLGPLLKKLSKEKKTCYLTGDFNMNLLSIEKDSDINKYFDLLTNNKFMPLITIPTRITTQSKTLIDNIFFNQFSSDIISGNITVGISDHIPQFSIIPNFHTPLKKYKIIFTRKYRNFDHNKFNEDLNKINWSLDDSSDANQYTSNFIHIIEQILDKHAPLSKISNKQLKQKSKPWIDNDVLKAIKVKNRIHHKYIKEQNPINKENFHIQFKQLKNDITKQIRFNKKLYYNDYFSKNNQNIRKLWMGINEIINSKPNSKFVPTCIETKIDGKLTTITEPKDIANTYNDHYTTIADKILEGRKYPGNKPFTKYLKDSNPHTFMIKPTTPKEIEDIILSFNT